jgi:hypothetical protein
MPSPVGTWKVLLDSVIPCKGIITFHMKVLPQHRNGQIIRLLSHEKMWCPQHEPSSHTPSSKTNKPGVHAMSMQPEPVQQIHTKMCCAGCGDWDHMLTTCCDDLVQMQVCCNMPGAGRPGLQ